MISRKHIIFILLINALIVSCKRYPEDSGLTLHTVKNRLKGSYRLDAYIVNGIDSVNYLQPCYNANIESIPKSQNDGKYYYKIIIDYKTMDIRGLDGKGTFSLKNKKKLFQFSYGLYAPNTFSTNYSNILYPCKSCNDDGIWEIMKLTTKEFWIKNQIGNKEYFLHLTKL